AVGEHPDARVLQESADDTTDADPLAESLDAGLEAANAAHDQVDLHTSLRCSIQRLDNLRMHEGIELRHDLAALSIARELCLAVDQLQKSSEHVGRRHEQLAIQSLT